MAFVFVFLTLVLYIVPHNIIGMQQLAWGSMDDTIKELANNNNSGGISTSGNNGQDKEKSGGISTSGNNGFSGNNDLDEK